MWNWIFHSKLKSTRLTRSHSSIQLIYLNRQKMLFDKIEPKIVEVLYKKSQHTGTNQNYTIQTLFHKQKCSQTHIHRTQWIITVNVDLLFANHKMFTNFFVPPKIKINFSLRRNKPLLCSFVIIKREYVLLVRTPGRSFVRKRKTQNFAKYLSFISRFLLL